jgi:hypothetical protein
MEYALRAETPADLADLPDDPREACAAAWRGLLPPGRWDAVYFGSEFCGESLPDAEAAAAFCRLAEARTLTPTLLTPPVTPAALCRVEDLLGALSEAGHRPAVVFNDWGVLRLLENHFPEHPRRAGRLLNRSLRDPRAAPGAPDGSGSDPSRGGRLRTFLSRRGAQALETDPDLEGSYLGDGGEGLQRALHLPFTFVTSGRHCLLKDQVAAGEDRPGFGSALGKPCRRTCRGGPRAVRRDDTPFPLWRAGNTLFYEASTAAVRVHLAQADRVVLHRRPVP